MPSFSWMTPGTLALTAGEGATVRGGGHYGIEVLAEDVDVALGRVRAVYGEADAAVEADTECCHSRQAKFWVTDPDGRRWEVFHVSQRESSAPGGPRRDWAPTVCCPTPPG